MKVIRKICVHLLVTVICVSSITLCYQKANMCRAASVGLGVTAAVLLVGVGLYGAYCIADDEVQDEVKQSFTDYKNMTVEGAKKSYAINKQLFNDFVAYAEANGASSACLYSAVGSSYSVAELSQAGFPQFDTWDDYFKKVSSSGSGGGWKNMLDKFMLAADLIGLMKSFCNDEFYSDGINGQLFYTGDEGYINRETGEVNIYFEIRNYTYDEYTYSISVSELNENIEEFDGGYSRSCSADNFRVCAVAQSYINARYWHYQQNWRILNAGWSVYLNACYGNGVLEKINIPRFIDGESTGNTYYLSGSFGLQFFDYDKAEYYSNVYYEPWGKYLTNNDSRYFPDYISSNIPFFATWEEAAQYLAGASKKPMNTLPVTPSDNFINNYSNTYITINNIINDVTGVDNEPTVTPVGDLTATPVPTLLVENDNDVTNNYIISITNILQPIQQSVTNIYNFFVIDTEKILPELDVDFVPAEKFQEITKAASVLRSSVPADVHDESGALAVEYPKITIQVPKILLNYVGDAAEEVDGKLVIVVCDFKDYALLFIRFRGFLAAVIWIGMIFYLLKQFEVTFSIS